MSYCVNKLELIKFLTSMKMMSNMAHMQYQPAQYLVKAILKV